MGKKADRGADRALHRDGFVYPIDAFAAEDARRDRRAMEEFERPRAGNSPKAEVKPHLLVTWVSYSPPSRHPRRG